MRKNWNQGKKEREREYSSKNLIHNSYITNRALNLNENNIITRKTIKKYIIHSQELRES